MRIIIESKKAGLVKAFLYAVATALVYYLIFSNTDKLMDIITRKDYIAPAVTMSITLLVASLLGTAVAKFLKHTLEKALDSQCMREE